MSGYIMIYMEYTDEEVLELTNSFATTKFVKGLVDKERERLRKNDGRNLSRAKIVANIIIRELDKQV